MVGITRQSKVCGEFDGVDEIALVEEMCFHLQLGYFSHCLKLSRHSASRDWLDGIFNNLLHCSNFF